jgi:hypothetical protein
MTPVMNNTKWDELRFAMYGLGRLSPKFRAQDKETGYLSDWDGEWFYHFRTGGYSSIKWVEIKIESPQQDAAVLAELARVHVPGQRTDLGFKVFGYVEGPIDYIVRDT